jgi:CRP/FNR family cyclic AMP-dependent transcriptional regulator
MGTFINQAEPMMNGFRVTDRLLLSKIQLFSGQPESIVLAVLKHGTRRLADAKTTVIMQGKTSHELLFLLSGAVSVVTTLRNGHEWMTDIVGAAGVVGNLPMKTDEVEPASVVTRQPCFFLALPNTIFRQLVKDHQSLAEAVISLLIKKMSQREDFIADVLFSDAEQRIAKCLLAITEVYATTSNGKDSQPHAERRDHQSSPIKIKISQRELSIMVGISRESVNRQLHQWMKQGLIGVSAGLIDVLKPDTLYSLQINNRETAT